MFKKILLVSAVLASFTSAHAATSAAFGSGAGTITPPACSVTLTGGTVTIGTLTQTTVKTYTTMGSGSALSYKLPPVTIGYAVTCSSLTKIALGVVDNNPGKATVITTTDSMAFGLVDGAASTAIGQFFLTVNTLTTDSTFVGGLAATTGTSTWAAAPVFLNALALTPGTSTGFIKSAGTTSPDAYTSLSGNMLATIFINGAYMSAASTAITPTASGTLSVIYL